MSNDEIAAARASTARLGSAIAVAVLGYAVLSFQTPAAWGPLFWGLAAFLVLPAFAGILAGGGEGPTGRRFWRAFGIVAGSMAIYTTVGMAITRGNMHSSDKSSDYFVYLVVAVVYAVIAGMVAGVSGTMFKGSKVAQ